MKSGHFIKRITSAVMAAAILFSGTTFLDDGGHSFLSAQQSLKAYAWDYHDPHNKGTMLTAFSGTGRNYLYPGDYLCNGNYKAIMQTDGNFVIYNVKTNQATWSSRTCLGTSYRDYRFSVQSDGNLVVYAIPTGISNASQRYIWTTDTCSYQSDYTLKLESNGVLALYRGRTGSGTRLWTNGDWNVCWNVELRTQYENDYDKIPLYGSRRGSSLRSAGCAVASATMIYNFFNGTDYHAASFNKYPYVSGGDLQWTSVKAVDSRTSKGDDCSYNKLASELHDGPVVIFLSNNGENGHFVVVNQCTKAGGPLKASDFRVRDPGNGNGLMRLDTAMSYAKKSNIAQIESWGTGRGKSMPKP